MQAGGLGEGPGASPGVGAGPEDPARPHPHFAFGRENITLTRKVGQAFQTDFLGLIRPESLTYVLFFVAEIW